VQNQHAPVRQWLLPISRALSAQPAIELRSLNWKSAEPQVVDKNAPPPVGSVPHPPGWQIQLEGRVEGDNEARTVQQEIDTLQQRLAQSGFQVAIVRSPLNYNPDGALRSQMLRQSDNPASLRTILSNSDFTLDLRWAAPGGARE
jgi:hypothetical protein